jgi:hypothetical protein
MKYLNEYILPQKYNIHMILDLNGNEFNGENNIEVECIKNTNIIQFHSLELKIESIELDQTVITINKQNMFYDKENDINTIILENNINIGKHTIKIKFSGEYSTVTGMAKYYNQDKNRTLFLTRCEPNFTRKIFPCWDEPSFKVKYNMTIQINDPSYVVLFNSDPINIKKTHNNTIIYQFQETVPMPTYVMSFIIGKFYFVEAYTKNNVRVRVYIPSDIPETNKVGDFALSYGVKIMNFITEYYNAPYPFNKMDFVPIDNADAKGMENYGLVFYDLPFLLFDKSTSTIDHMIGIVLVIAHEIAHQWFGNLVTMNKWNELWLKESFAKFFEYYIVDHLCPEWRIRSNFIKGLFRTFDFDSVALNSVKVDKIMNKQMIHIYDDVTYFKGATMLFMIQDIIGKEQFKICLQNYLNKYKFSTTTVNDFINCLIENLNETQKVHIESIIKTYTTNKGTPIIKFNNNTISVVPFNSRKIINNIIKNKEPLNSYTNKWTIPIKFDNSDKDYVIISDGKKKYEINDIINYNNVSNHNHNISINNIDIVNDKSIGYYRICYTKEQFTDIINDIKNINDYQLMSIFNDLFILSVYNLSDIKYWIIYTYELVKHLTSINNPYKFNHIMVTTIYNQINNIKGFFSEKLVKNIYSQKQLSKANNNYDITLKKINKKLIKHLNNIFDAFNTQLFINNNFFSDNISYNSILLFLLEINEEKSRHIIEYFITNKLFNISGDINRIIVKHLIKQNNTQKIIELKDTQLDLSDIIISSIKYTSNKKLIDLIINLYFEKKIQLSFSDISQFISSNKYFADKFTENFISKYDIMTQILPVISKGFTRILISMILHQTDPNIIDNLLTKFESVGNKEYSIKLNQSKNILFNKIFMKINLVKLLSEL